MPQKLKGLTNPSLPWELNFQLPRHQLFTKPVHPCNHQLFTMCSTTKTPALPKAGQAIGILIWNLDLKSQYMLGANYLFGDFLCWHLFKVAIYFLLNLFFNWVLSHILHANHNFSSLLSTQCLSFSPFSSPLSSSAPSPFPFGLVQP